MKLIRPLLEVPTIMKLNRTSFIACVALVAAVAIPTLSIAQAPPAAGGGQRQGGGGGRGMSGMFLLMMPEVQKELKITAAQKSSLEKALSSMMPGSARPPQGAQGGGAGRPPQGGQGGQRPDFAAMEKKVMAVLTAAQKTRLEELRLQQSGANAFRRDEVAKKVGLTDKQKKAIEDIMEKARPNMTRGGQGGGQQDFEKMRKEMMAKRAAANKAAMALLTPAQKATWAKMTGKPFTFPPMQMRMGGGGGRGGTTPR